MKNKRTRILAIMVLTLLASSTTVAGIPAVTQDGYIACQTEEWLDDFLDFLTANDKASAQAYLDANRCISIKGGLQVTIVDVGLTKHQFAFRGVKLWTVREALKTFR